MSLDNISELLTTKSSADPGAAGASKGRSAEAQAKGVLIVNADDWGWNHETTDRISECVLRGTVSSVSAMVFMEDSERAATVARERVIDAGLHLNLITSFSAARCATSVVQRQQELSKYLQRHRFAQAMFHPALTRSFEYVVSAQLEEFSRLYGRLPGRIDGHHHMHLCANVLLAKLLPVGTIVRRNLSFQPGEKSLYNRHYRQVVDRMLARRHRLTDFFLSLAPLEPPGRLQRIFSVARQSVVELMTHPVNSEEYRFLAGGEIFRWTEDYPIAPCFAVRSNGNASC
jgi:predicted glycoside hydrolase/deacetylase ChbG (UPF0249 family)